MGVAYNYGDGPSDQGYCNPGLDHSDWIERTRRRSVQITERDNVEIREEMDRIKNSLTELGEHLPSPDEMHSHATGSEDSKSDEICSVMAEEMDVESAMINVPQALDMVAKGSPCVIAKVDDNLHLADDDAIHGFMEAWSELFKICQRDDDACIHEIMTPIKAWRGLLKELFGNMVTSIESEVL